QSYATNDGFGISRGESVIKSKTDHPGIEKYTTVDLVENPLLYENDRWGNPDISTSAEKASENLKNPAGMPYPSHGYAFTECRVDIQKIGGRSVEVTHGHTRIQFSAIYHQAHAHIRIHHRVFTGCYFFGRIGYATRADGSIGI